MNKTNSKQLTGNKIISLLIYARQYLKTIWFFAQDQSHYLKSLWILNELQPLLNSLRLSIETASTTRAENADNIWAIGIGLGAVAIAMVLIMIGLLVCFRMGAATRNRMNNAIMGLCTETNMRPNNLQPPFRIWSIF